MSLPIKPKVSPARLADFTPAWLHMRREIVLRDGHAIRVSHSTKGIEVQAINTGTWHPLTLPGGTTQFDSSDDLIAVFRMLTGETPLPANPA